MADLQKVMDALRHCAVLKSCDTCPYDEVCKGTSCNPAMADAAELLEKQSIKIADLKLERKKLRSDPDRVKVVRCADCRYWEPENAEEGDCSGRCRNNYAPCQNQQTDMTWFCADGEREG